MKDKIIKGISEVSERLIRLIIDDFYGENIDIDIITDDFQNFLKQELSKGKEEK